MSTTYAVAENKTNDIVNLPITECRLKKAFPGEYFRKMKVTAPTKADLHFRLAQRGVYYVNGSYYMVTENGEMTQVGVNMTKIRSRSIRNPSCLDGGNTYVKVSNAGWVAYVYTSIDTFFAKINQENRRFTLTKYD